MYTPTMRRSAAVLLAAMGLLILLAPAADAALYTINITQPASSASVSGSVTVHVDTSGVNTPSNAAYQVNSGTWSDSSKIGMSKSGSDFQAGFDSSAFANGSYKVLVRAWNSGIKSYNPNDSSTYASDSVSIKISNSPSPPSNVLAYGGQGSASVEWYAIPTADRSDFTGYRVYRAQSSGGSCPAFDAYESQGTTYSTTHSESGLAVGTYCFVVTATRSSPSSGTVESSPSPSATADVSPSGSPSPTPSGSPGGSPSPGGIPSPGGSPSPSIPPGPFIKYGRAPGAHAPNAPNAPAVPGGYAEGDEGYQDNLPYGPQQVNQPVDGAANGGSRTIGGSGSDSRRQAKLLLAWGFLLVGIALLLRSFLGSQPATPEGGIVEEAGAGEVTIAEAASAEGDPTDLVDQKDVPRGKSRRSSRRKD